MHVVNVYVDWDGPIVDVRERYYQAHRDVAVRYGLPEMEPEHYWAQKRLRLGPGEILGHGVTDEVAQQYEAERRELIEAEQFLQYNTLQPGVTVALAALAARFDVVVVSLRNYPDRLQAEVDRLGVRRYVKAVLARSDNSGTFDVKVNLVRAYSGSGVAFIGDTELDMRAGQVLGLHTIAVTNGIRTEALLSAAGADDVVDNIQAATTLVLSEISPTVG